MNHIASKFLEVDQPKNSSNRSHPKVEGSANFISLEVRSNSDYFGPLYIGSEYREERVLFDTASSWVTVSNIRTKNAEIMSNYDIGESTKANPVYMDSRKTNMK